MDGIEPEARRLLASGVLGRSPQLVELFEYLVQASTRNRSPKEAEIAQDVFGRDASFEPGQDALVRVHVHRLRTKLERFYADQPAAHGVRLAIPKGEYRLVLEDSSDARPAQPPAALEPVRSWPWRGIAAGLALICLVLTSVIPSRPPPPAAQAVAPSLLWDGFRSDSRTALIIVGDRVLPGTEETGLPVGVATALRHVIPALVAGDSGSQRLRLLPMSQVTPDMMRAANIIYIGQLSDIAMIGEPLFAVTQVVPAPDGRSLSDRASGRVLARAPGPESADGPQGQSDFGYIASFRGPSANRIVVIAGGGNAGLMQAAEVAGSDARIREVAAKAGSRGDFEAVLTVTSLHDMNMGSRLELVAPLDAAAIWREAAGD